MSRYINTQNSIKTPKNKAKKTILRIFFIFFLIVVFLTCFLLPFAFKAKKIYINSFSAKSNIEQGIKSIEDKNFDLAAKNFNNAHNEFEKAYNEIQIFNEMNFLSEKSMLSVNRIAVNNILNAGINISYTLNQLSEFGNEIMEFISSEKNTAFDQLSEESQKKIIDILKNSPEKLADIESKLNLALISLNQIPRENLIDQINKNIDPLIDKTTELKKIVSHSNDLITLIPNLIGYPEEKVYLFLFLNNTELRPTGGFIGSYGIIKVHNGKIYDFYTDDIYNLDRSVDVSTWKHIAPEPIQQYLGVEKWYMRDSNWSPDFETAAKQALFLYKEEGGKEQNINGVIAVTPDVIGKLLDYYGGIESEGIKFTSENFVDTVEYKVEKEYAQIGLKESERKQIIGKLARQLIDNIKSANYNDIINLTEIIDDSLNQKDIMIYDNDQSFAHILRAKNWDGKIQKNKAVDDYLMVVDANLSSLKTDQVMDKNINYTLSYTDDGKLKAHVEINYTNTGTFTWKTTRYNTFTRIYVPKGSKLINATGLVEGPRINHPGDVYIDENHDKTIFGGFISIEPKESKSLTFQYILPDTISDQIKNNKKYSILVQKQPGTYNDFTIDANFGNVLQSLHIGTEKIPVNKEQVTYSTILSTDMELSIDLAS